MANRPWRDSIFPFAQLNPAQKRKIKCYVVGHELCTRGLQGSCYASEDFLAVDLLVIDTGPGAGLLPTPALRTLAASVANLDWDKLQSALSFSSPEWHVFKEDVEEVRAHVQLEMSQAPAGGNDSSSSEENLLDPSSQQNDLNPIAPVAVAAGDDDGEDDDLGGPQPPPHALNSVSAASSLANHASQVGQAAQSIINGEGTSASEHLTASLAQAITNMALAIPGAIASSSTHPPSSTGSNGGPVGNGSTTNRPPGGPGGPPGGDGGGGGGGSNGGLSAGPVDRPTTVFHQTEVVPASVFLFFGEENPSAHGYISPELVIREIDNKAEKFGWTGKGQVDCFRTMMAGKAHLWFAGLMSATRDIDDSCTTNWTLLKTAFRRRFGYGDSLFHIDFRELLLQKENESPIMFVSRFREGIDKFATRYGDQLWRDAFPRQQRLLTNTSAPLPPETPARSFFRFPQNIEKSIADLFEPDPESSMAVRNFMRRRKEGWVSSVQALCVQYLQQFLKDSKPDYIHAFKTRYEFWELCSHLKSDKLREYAFNQARAQYEKPDRISSVVFWDNLQQKMRSMQDSKALAPPPAATISQVDLNQQTAEIAARQKLLSQYGISPDANADALVAALTGKKPNGKKGKKGKGKGKGKGQGQQQQQAGKSSGAAKFCSFHQSSKHSDSECRAKNGFTPDGRRIMDHRSALQPHARMAPVAAAQEQQHSAPASQSTQLYTVEQLLQQGYLPPIRQAAGLQP